MTNIEVFDRLHMIYDRVSVFGEDMHIAVCQNENHIFFIGEDSEIRMEIRYGNNVDGRNTKLSDFGVVYEILHVLNVLEVGDYIALEVQAVAESVDGNLGINKYYMLYRVLTGVYMFVSGNCMRMFGVGDMIVCNCLKGTNCYLAIYHGDFKLVDRMEKTGIMVHRVVSDTSGVFGECYALHYNTEGRMYGAKDKIMYIRKSDCKILFYDQWVTGLEQETGLAFLLLNKSTSKNDFSKFDMYDIHTFNKVRSLDALKIQVAGGGRYYIYKKDTPKAMFERKKINLEYNLLVAIDTDNQNTVEEHYRYGMIDIYGNEVRSAEYSNIEYLGNDAYVFEKKRMNGDKEYTVRNLEELRRGYSIYIDSIVQCNADLPVFMVRIGENFKVAYNLTDGLRIDDNFNNIGNYFDVRACPNGSKYRLVTYNGRKLLTDEYLRDVKLPKEELRRDIIENSEWVRI